MAEKERKYVSTMGSISKLQDRCNHDELNIPGKLLSLAAKTDASGVKHTVATYEILEEPDGVGNLALAQSATADDTAWILTVERNIEIVRD